MAIDMFEYVANRIRGLFSPSACNMDERELVQVAWKEEKELTDTIYTLKLVWPGGKEKEVTFSHEQTHGSRHCFALGGAGPYIDEDGEEVLNVTTEPAYHEVVNKERIVTGTKTKRRTAWVEKPTYNRDYPPETEKTDKTKTVYENE